MIAYWQWLLRWLGWTARPSVRLRWGVFSSSTPFLLFGDSPMAFVLPIDHRVTAFLSPMDYKGNPAAIDGVPVWEVSDPNLVTLVVADDGLSAIITPSGNLGSVQIRATADARLGPEVREITALLQVDLVAAEAVSLGIVVGDVEPMPDPVAAAADPVPTPIE